MTKAKKNVVISLDEFNEIIKLMERAAEPVVRIHSHDSFGDIMKAALEDSTRNSRNAWQMMRQLLHDD